jgi:hypothetical protein
VCSPRKIGNARKTESYEGRKLWNEEEINFILCFFVVVVLMLMHLPPRTLLELSPFSQLCRSQEASFHRWNGQQHRKYFKYKKTSQHISLWN